MNLILDVVVLVLLGMTIVYAARLSLQLKRLRDSRGDMDKIVRELVRNIDKAGRAVVMLRESADEQGAKLQRIIGNAVSLADELQLMTDSGDRLASRLEKLVDGVTPLTRDIQAQTDAMIDRAEQLGASVAGGRASSGVGSGVFSAQTAQNAPFEGGEPRIKGGANVAMGAQRAKAGVKGGVEQPKTADLPHTKPYSEHLRKVDGADVRVIHSQPDDADKPLFAIRDPEVERGMDPFEQGVGDDPALYSEAERDLFRAIKGLYER